VTSIQNLLRLVIGRATPRKLLALDDLGCPCSRSPTAHRRVSSSAPLFPQLPNDCCYCSTFTADHQVRNCQVDLREAISHCLPLPQPPQCACYRSPSGPCTVALCAHHRFAKPHRPFPQCLHPRAIGIQSLFSCSGLEDMDQTCGNGFSHHALQCFSIERILAQSRSFISRNATAESRLSNQDSIRHPGSSFLPRLATDRRLNTSCG